MTYDERLTELIIDERIARARKQGFMDAKSFPEWNSPITWTHDLAEQHCYNASFMDGKRLLSKSLEDGQ